jgi:hypothetical protein
MVTVPRDHYSVRVPLVGRLAALFARLRDRRRLNAAQPRLRATNERLWSGLAPDAFGLIYHGVAPASASQIARRMRPPGPDHGAQRVAGRPLGDRH